MYCFASLRREQNVKTTEGIANEKKELQKKAIVERNC